MRWLLLDEVVAIRRGEFAHTRSRIPETSVTVELLLMEMMAQTGALLLGAEKDFQEDLVFAKIEEASFHSGFEPDQKIEIRAVSDNLRPEGAWFHAEVHTGSQKIAGGRFFLINVGRLVPNQTKPITFHENFMNHFQIRRKIQ
ncbi:MAG: hypothetical protein HYZ84_01860 [Candidatus Omnitrophica bacterium]|nr:hypothetical protein [Candidatus Omnitrophota bacterium]